MLLHHTPITTTGQSFIQDPHNLVYLTHCDSNTQQVYDVKGNRYFLVAHNGILALAIYKGPITTKWDEKPFYMGVNIGSQSLYWCALSV